MTQTTHQPPAPNRKLTRFLPHIPRVLLGLLFAMTGSNVFLHFIPDPPKDSLSPAMTDFLTALINTRYMLPMIGLSQLLPALLLLANRFVPLAVVLLGPTIVNILLLHLFLERSGLPMAIFVLVLWSSLVYFHRNTYRPLFTAKPAAVI